MMRDELKKLRKQAGYTQAELAERLGLSQSTVACWENGKRRPDLDTLPILAKFYGVSVNDLYGDEEQPTNSEEEQAWVIRERLRRDPSFRLLFDAASDAPPEHLRAAAAMLKALEPNEEEDDEL